MLPGALEVVGRDVEVGQGAVQPAVARATGSRALGAVNDCWHSSRARAGRRQRATGREHDGAAQLVDDISGRAQAGDRLPNVSSACCTSPLPQP